MIILGYIITIAVMILFFFRGEKYRKELNKKEKSLVGVSYWRQQEALRIALSYAKPWTHDSGDDCPLADKEIRYVCRIGECHMYIYGSPIQIEAIKSLVEDRLMGEK